MHLLSDAQVLATILSVIVATVGHGVVIWGRIRKEQQAIASLDGGLADARAEIATIKKSVNTIERALAAQAHAGSRSTPYGRRATDKPPEPMRANPLPGPHFDPKH